MLNNKQDLPETATKRHPLIRWLALPTAALVSLPILILGPMATATAASAVGSITTYTAFTYLGQALGEPEGIAAGPDGDLWYVNAGADSAVGPSSPDGIGRITTGGTVTTFTGGIGIDQPYSIAAGHDGAMWFTNIGNNTIGRITTSGEVSNYAGLDISLGGSTPSPSVFQGQYPNQITAGPDGAMWFTNVSNNSIGRINMSGTVTNYTGPGISHPMAITAGPDGALWFTNNGNNTIGRITTTGKITTYTGPDIKRPVGIASGPDGAMWFTDSGNESIGRITMAGKVTNYKSTGIITPWAITAGPDGAMWFPSQGNNAIGRITMAGKVTAYAGTGIGMWGIAAGSDKALWITNAVTDTIGRVPTNVAPLIPTSGAKGTMSTTANGLATKPKNRTPHGSAVAASHAETSLDAVSCTEPNACTAVGESGPVNAAVLVAERWNGTKWAIQPVPSPSPPGSTTVELEGVSCTSATACTAVGNSESTLLAVKWNGTKWAIQPTPPNPPGSIAVELEGVSCTSPTACTAVGSLYNGATTQSLAERWNGTKWTTQPTPMPVGATSSSLSGVSCTSPTSCTADGTSYLPSGFEYPLAERWNGTKWTIQSTPNPSGSTQTNLVAISCTSPNACSAVGNTSHGYGAGPAPLAERWNGAKWTMQSTPNPTGSTLTLLLGVSCTSSNACTAVGHFYNGIITSLAERWNGTKWAIQPTPNSLTSTTPTTTTTTTTTTTPPASQFSLADLEAAAVTQSGLGPGTTANCGPAPTGLGVGAYVACGLFNPNVGVSVEVLQITGALPSSFNVVVGPGSSIPCSSLNTGEQAAFSAQGETCSSNG